MKCGLNFASLLAAFALAATLATPVNAQDTEMVFSIDAVDSCLANADGPLQSAACIGLATEQCRTENDGGFSAIGTIACVAQEMAFWDSMLADEQTRLAVDARRIDDASGSTDAGSSLSTSLQAMQDTWTAYRDATCFFEEVQWGGSAGGNAAFAGCVMEMTGAQALKLRETELEN